MNLSKDKKTILVMDDEPGIVEIIEDSISMLDDYYDFEVHKASTGTAGLAKIKDTAYDLIITDIKMPEMTGEEFIEEKAGIKNSNATTPLIVITGFSNKLARYPNIFVLDKPFECKQLKNMILLHLNSAAKQYH